MPHATRGRGKLRIGILGAAAIAPDALLTPGGDIPEVVVTAVAARDRSRAEAYAARHEIAVVHDPYGKQGPGKIVGIAYMATRRCIGHYMTFFG